MKIMKKFIATLLAGVAALATFGMTSCFGEDTNYVATAIQSESNEQYGLAVGKNSSNKTAILAAMNEVIADIEIADIVSYYESVYANETPTVTLEFADLSDNTAGTLEVYTNAEFAPFEFRDNNNNVVGVDM